jgi:hypothetical protein
LTEIRKQRYCENAHLFKSSKCFRLCDIFREEYRNISFALENIILPKLFKLVLEKSFTSRLSHILVAIVYFFMKKNVEEISHILFLANLFAKIVVISEYFYMGFSLKCENARPKFPDLQRYPFCRRRITEETHAHVPHSRNYFQQYHPPPLPNPHKYRIATLLVSLFVFPLSVKLLQRKGFFQ